MLGENILVRGSSVGWNAFLMTEVRREWPNRLMVTGSLSSTSHTYLCDCQVYFQYSVFQFLWLKFKCLSLQGMQFCTCHCLVINRITFIIFSLEVLLMKIHCHTQCKDHQHTNTPTLHLSLQVWSEWNYQGEHIRLRQIVN